MKKNLPITDNEVTFQAHELLVSETDTKGRITYANPAFVEISGFSREQLMGSSHNIVRHPDMPPAAFEDLWNTLKAGHPWRGLVKNRCQNGDFYWVEAFVTPVKKGGKTIGYVSVRSLPNRAAVTEADRLYKAIQAGKASFPTTSVSWLEKTSFMARAQLAFLVMALCPLGLAALASTGLSLGVLWAAAIASVVLIVGAGGWWIWQANRSLNRLRDAINAMEEGSFSHQLHIATLDEFPDLLMGLEKLRIHWRALVSDVMSMTQRVAESSATLHNATGRLTQDVDQQVDRVSTVSAGLEQLSVAIRQTSEHAHGASVAAERVGSDVDAGREHMRSSREVSERVVSVVNNTQTSITQLVNGVATIAQVTHSIKEIADQTNLLALNAAIEAARAGEQGRGFAIVADEVRKLAERTTASTIEIDHTVEEVRALAQVSVASMQSTGEEVKGGFGLIEAAHHSLENIAEVSGEANQLVSEIDDTIMQQSSALQEIAQAVEQISGAQESGAQQVKAVNSVASNLSTTARELSDLVRHFDVTAPMSGNIQENAEDVPAALLRSRASPNQRSLRH